MSKLRFSILLALAVALIGTPAVAGKVDVEFNGDLRTRFDQFEDYDFNDDVDDDFNVWGYKAAIGMTAGLAKNVKVHAELLAFGDLGRGGTIPNYQTVPNVPDSTPIWPSAAPTSSSGDVDLYQGYVTLEELGGSKWTILAGRFEMAFGNELMLGDNDFYNGLTWDGAAAHAKYDGWDLGILFLNVEEEDPISNTPPDPNGADDDQWLFGAKAGFEVGGGNLTPYVIQWRDDADGAARIDLTTIGALWTADDEDTAWDASAEFAIQTGDSDVSPSEVDYGGTIFEGEFGWSFDDAGRVFLNLLMASGDDGTDATDNESFQPIYPDPHVRLGNADIFAPTNIQDISFGYGFTKGDDTHEFGIAVHLLTLAEDQAGATNPTFGGSTLVVNEDDLGQEIDLNYAFNYSDNVTFDVGIATLLAGDAFGADVDDTMRFWGGLEVTWGK